MSLKSDLSEENCAVKTVPPFGFISGIATIIGFLPHILFLLGVTLFHGKNITSFFLLFTIGARILGDWIFWSQIFPRRMDSGENTEAWRSLVKGILYSKPISIGAMFDMVIDAIVDGLLLYVALKVSVYPVLVFLVFSSCQAIGAPIQGMLIFIFTKRNIRLLSVIVSAIATYAALEVGGLLHIESYENLLGLTQLGKPAAMLIILSAKCLFTGTTVIAKASIAEAIKIETRKKNVKSF
ncbi:MAG: hypothetical protein P0S96_07730 [Simkaniaceae bacterium]|nr:hypothetical protein [Candidatus Sacchlamyda saccharinae]